MFRNAAAAWLAYRLSLRLSCQDPGSDSPERKESTRASKEHAVDRARRVHLVASVPEAGQTVGTTTGAISGKVTDETGAVLPGVTIGFERRGHRHRGTRTAVTSEDGLYRFPALPPGEYTLLFTLEGFRTVSREGVHLGLGFTATVNVEMDIAALNQSVTVERKSPVIDTQSTAITTTSMRVTRKPAWLTKHVRHSERHTGVQVGHFEIGGSSGEGGPTARTGPRRESPDGRGHQCGWDFSLRLHPRFWVVRRGVGGHGRARR